MPGATTTPTVVRPKPLKIDHADVLADYNDARADALPISRAVNRDYFMRYFSLGDPTNDPQKTSTKVSLWRLLSFSTVNERWLMIFGLLMATVSGLGMPVWLILLNRSLDELSNLSTLMGSVANDRLMDLVQGKLKDLCIAFTIVGLVSLVTGALYVSIWTYTGEKQALRIRSQYFRSIINQDAAWFDHNDREALPTKMGSALIHINNAIGRHVVDVYSNVISAIGCLIVALLMNAARSVVILLFVPVAMIIMALINACIRRVKKHANKEMSKAGGIATEVLSGIKTVASLCAQPYFEDKYQKHVRESARSSAKAAALSGLSAGIAGALFYVAYTVAFYVGTEQVVDGAQMATILNCFISGEPQCRVTGAAVMCTIYGVILCITFIGMSDIFHYSALVTSSTRCVKSTQLFFVPRSSWAQGSLLSILGDLRL